MFWRYYVQFIKPIFEYLLANLCNIVVLCLFLLIFMKTKNAFTKFLLEQCSRILSEDSFAIIYNQRREKCAQRLSVRSCQKIELRAKIYSLTSAVILHPLIFILLEARLTEQCAFLVSDNHYFLLICRTISSALIAITFSECYITIFFIFQRIKSLL